MSIVNHTKLSKLNFPKRDRKYLLKITIRQCESHLLYMQIFNPSHHSCQHVNQILTKATPNCIRNTPSGFCYHIKCFDDTLYSQEPVIFAKENDDDDVAQIFTDTLEKNIKDMINWFMTTLPLSHWNWVKIECVIIVI